MTMNLIEMIKKELESFNYDPFLDYGIAKEDIIKILLGNKPTENLLIKCLAEYFDKSLEEMRNIIDKTPWNPPSGGTPQWR
jgi:hypothetical protein